MKEKNVRYRFDERLNISPGFKFNEWEMKGVPIRVEVGSRDMEAGTLCCVRRDTGKKQSYNINFAASELYDLLDNIQKNMFDQANQFREENTHSAVDYDEFKSLIDKGGFIRCGWDGDADTEAAIKVETKATIRCILPNNISNDQRCIYSGKIAKHDVIFARAY